MKWTSISARAATALALAMAVALPASARGDDNDKNRDKGDQQASQDNQDKIRQLRVFELEHRDPHEINRIIAMRTWAESPGHAAVTPDQAVVPRQPGAVQQWAHYRAPDSDRVTTAVNAEEKLLFVRGSEDQIKEIEQLVNAFDVKDEELEAHDYGRCRLIPIRSEKIGQVKTTLLQLNLPGEMIRLGEVSLVTLRMDEGNDQKCRQAEEVINKLDARMKDLSRAQDKDKNDEEEEKKKKDDDGDS